MLKIEKALSSGGSALDVLHGAFEALVRGPRPPGLPGAVVGLGGTQTVPLDEVRELLLDRRCPREVRDAAWRELVARSRRSGPEGSVWTVGAAGVAWPALVAAAGRCADAAGAGTGAGIERAEIDAAVVEGFVSALAAVDLTRPGVVTRLRWAAFRAGRESACAALEAPAPVGGEEDMPPRSSWSTLGASTGGDASLVLLTAVGAEVLNLTEFRLICETRLDGDSLAEVAARLELSYDAARHRRARAERRLLTRIAPRVGSRDTTAASPTATASQPRPTTAEGNARCT